MLNGRLSRILWVLLITLATACSGKSSDTPQDPVHDVEGDDTSEDTSTDDPIAPDVSNDADPDEEPLQEDPSEDAETQGDTVEEPPPRISSDFWSDSTEFIQWADLFIGSGGPGFGYASLTPAVQVPHGFVKVGPDTTRGGVHPPQQHFSGYYDSDPDIRAFSHVRLVGTGAPDLGLMRVMPLRALPEDPTRVWSRRDRAFEEARLGRYVVSLPDEEVRVSLTATAWSAWHHIETEGDDPVVLYFDLPGNLVDREPLDASFLWEDETLRMMIHYQGPFVGRVNAARVHACATLDPPPDRAFIHEEGAWAPGASSQGPEARGALQWDTPPETVALRIGFSLVSADNACTHREEELLGTWEATANATEGAWWHQLGDVRIRGGYERDARLLATALMNLHRMPTRLDETDGRFAALDGEIGTWTHDGGYYTDLSLWDSFRTLHPLYELLYPELQVSVLRSLMDMAERTGFVPRWPGLTSETGSMTGAPAAMLFAGGLAKDLPGIDWNHALDLLYEGEFGSLSGGPRGRSGVADYVDTGWYASDHTAEGPSKTLEYAWADFSIDAMARALDRADDVPFATAMRRAWTEHWHEESGFFQPRHSDGTFEPVSRPTTVYMGGGAFIEGSAWHWRFYPIWDFDHFVTLFGGPERLREELTTYFERSGIGSPQPLVTTLPDPYYWHGNEPPLHNVFSWLWTSTPEMTHYWIDRILTKAYNETPAGLPGNDDGGTLSAWLVGAMIGLMPIPGTDLYFLGRPRFERIDLTLIDGWILDIQAPGAPWTTEPTRITLNGEPIEGHTVRHSDLLGSTLRFERIEP